MMRMDFNPCHWRVLAALFCVALPLTLMATDVVVADANGNELTYSYDSADGPATFKGVKRYAADENKAGRIIIADRVTDTNGVSHEVKYVSGSVSNRGNLVSIVFGQNIVATGGPDGSKSDAFSGCNQLESVTLNAKLETLGTYTFLNCYNLASINLGDCKKLTTIKASAIEDCDYVRSITIPASVTTIEKNAFYSIDSLRTVTFATGSQLQNMGGEGTFRECLKLESVNLEACTQLKSIGSYTFRYCTELQAVTIPASVETIGSDIFYYADNIRTLTFLAPRVPKSFCSYRSKLTTINIGAGVKDIGEYAFMGNSALTKVNFDPAVSGLSIQRDAFANCDFIRSFTLPAGVVSLSNGAFNGCDSLRSFTFAKDSPIKEIPRDCFGSNHKLESIKLPDAVETIGIGAFYGDTSLREIEFGTGLTTIVDDYGIFYYCPIEKMVLPGATYPFKRNPDLPSLAVLYVHPELVDIYRETDFTKNYRIMAIGATTSFAVTTTAGGQLKDRVREDKAQFTQELTVSGPLNGNDIDYLHSAFPNIEVLNLKNARIVAGGDPYHQWNVSSNGTATMEPYYGPWPTEDNVISRCMFYNIPTLRSLSLPKDAKKIGDWAVGQDRNQTLRLAYIEIPSGVTEIGRNAFEWSGIENVTIPSGITRLEQYTFANCRKLKKAVLPNGITFIGHSCFSECHELEDVNIPTKVETIEHYAFNNNKKRSTPIVIPNTCKTIGNFAFCHNDIVPSVTFGNSIETIGGSAFAACYRIREAVLPNSITSLADRVFQDCDSLRTFTFPPNIKQVPGWFFEWCDGLTTVTLANGTTSIGESAFNTCRSLTNINISSQTALTTINSWAFSGSGLKNVVLPNQITSIGSGIFQDCNELESVNVPTSIDFVPYDYCEGCEKLRSVQMHDGIRTIRYDAFVYCDSLESINLNDNITRIEYNAFNRCQKLALTKLPAALTFIGASAFCDMKAMTGTMIIPTGVKTMESDAFRNTNISSVVIPEGITSMGTNIFYDCALLSNVSLPKDITTITDRMFEYCKSLESIDLPNELRLIGYASFYGSGLTSILLPDSLKDVGDWAFSNTKLRTFRVPDTFTDDLGAHCLENCKQLKSVYFGLNQDYSQWSSFTAVYGCDSLELMRIYAGTPPKSDTYAKDFRFNCVLEVPEDQIALYKEANFWKDFKEVRGFYTGDELRDQDFAVMQTLYNKCNGSSWEKPWNMESNRHSVGKWAGITTEQIGTSKVYAITDIDLSSSGLTGELPKDVFRLRNLKTLNLSRNHISGNLNTVLEGITADKRAPLTSVNLQGNRLTGDLYAFAAQLPALTSLDVSYNQLSEVSKPISKSVSLNMQMQFVDWHTRQVVEADNLPVQDVVVGQPFTPEVTQLFSYRHNNQDYGHTNFTLARVYYTNSWQYDWEFDRNNDGTLNLGTNDNNYFRGPKGKPAAYSDLESSWRTLLLRFTWTDGDVNVDQTVDVLDLQDVIYYALNNQKPSGQKYNLTAADDNQDGKVNVVDVTRSVDYVMSNSLTAASRAHEINNENGGSHNLLTCTGSSLTLANADEVAAMQFVVAGASQGDIHVNADVRSRFSVALGNVPGGVRVVLYSAVGSTLPAGNHQLLDQLPNGATVVEAVLADPEARRLGVGIDGEVPTTIERLSIGSMADMSVYDLSGRRLGPWDTLPAGIYVVRMNGQQYKLRK